MDDLINDGEAESSKSKKRKLTQAPSNKSYKQQKIEENNIENINFEVEEWRIALRERELQLQSQEVANRRALAEAEALEIANLEKKKALGLL